MTYEEMDLVVCLERNPGVSKCAIQRTSRFNPTTIAYMICRKYRHNPLKNLELIRKIGQGQIITYQVLTNSQTQSSPTIFSSMRSADLCVSLKQQWQRCLCNHSQTLTYLAQHAPQVEKKVIIVDIVCKTPNGNHRGPTPDKNSHRVEGELFPLPTKYHDPRWGFNLY